MEAQGEKHDATCTQIRRAGSRISPCARQEDLLRAHPSALHAVASPRPARRKSLPYYPLVVVAIAAAGGISLDRYGAASLSLNLECLFATSLLVAWLLLWRLQRDALASWAVLGAAAFTAAAWHDLRWTRFEAGEIGRYATDRAQPACIEAIAQRTPDRIAAPPSTPLRAIPVGERSRLLVRVTAIRDRTHWQRAGGVCQLIVNGHLLGVRAGDRLRIIGQLTRSLPPLNPGEFDFAAHARADRQLARLRSSAPESVVVLQRGGRFNLSVALEAARSGAKRLVRQFVGPKQAGLAMAILLGDREGLPYDQTEPYLVTGTIHVLVVSGMNVAILAAGMLSFMRMGWLARRAGLAMIMVIVAGYALLTDLQPPVVRAAVMGLLFCAAAWTGRRGIAFNSLAAAAMIVLAMNPADLFRPGPQLSFLAVIALVNFGCYGSATPTTGPSPSLDRWFGADGPWGARLLVKTGRWIGWFGRPPDRLEELILSTRPPIVRQLIALARFILLLFVTALAVWLVTLPLVLMHFHVGSPISVVVSPAVWLCVLVAMWSGFAMLTLGLMIPSAGALCGWMCGASLAGLDRVVEWAESFPAGHFWAPGPAWWWVLGFYVALLAVMFWGRFIVPVRWQLAALAAWVLLGLTPTVVRTVSRDGLLCSFVAVGHGTCVVVESPTGETLVYDAGSLGSPEAATQSIASYLWHRGIRRIDGLVISHADVDHYNAVPGLLERFHIGTVYVSPVMFAGFGESTARGGPQTLREAILAADVPIREIWAGDRLRLGPSVFAEILHPPRRGIIGSDNANSLTLAIEYQNRRILLPGDLDSPGLEDVMAELPYDCDALLAPHHGSRQSDPPGFAAWTRPEWVIISGGASTRDLVQPAAVSYRRAGAAVLPTFNTGAVKISFRANGIQTITHRPADLAGRGSL